MQYCRTSPAELSRLDWEERRAENSAEQAPEPLLAPAISNAVANLTGRRLRHTPFTPDRVRQALA